MEPINLYPLSTTVPGPTPPGAEPADCRGDLTTWTPESIPGAHWEPAPPPAPAGNWVLVWESRDRDPLLPARGA